MSSMFKKKGGPAFKPKIPSARSRPVARPAQPTPPVEAEPILTETTDTSPQEDLTSTITGDNDAENPTQSTSLTEKTLPHPTPPATEETVVVRPRSEASEPPPRDHREEQVISKELVSGPQTEKAPEQFSSADTDPTPEASDPVPVTHDAVEQTHDASQATPTLVDETPTPAPAAKPKPKTTRTRKAAVPEASIEEVAEGQEVDAKPKRRQRKAATQNDGENAPKPRQRKRKTTERGEDAQPARRRKARSVTPEDAESQTVDLQKLKMADLTRDLHIGKKFSRHDELRERERQKRMKTKLEKDDDASQRARSESARPAKEQSGTPGASAPPTEEPPSQAPAGPQFRIVDGQIVVDQNSLAVDRHARAAAARAGEDMETIEENDFTRLITSNSFMNTSKLKGPNVWTAEETVLFYRGLAMFGTDFEIISKMIPGKQRRHVKLKFNREERHCPRRINAALVGEKTVAMDLDEYRAATGAEYESVEAIEAEQQKIEDGYEAERKRIADEQAEVMRKKKEELFADEDVGGVVPKKKKKGKKKKVEYGLNGEPVED
ncbi:myb DNA-binding like domain-containing protein [Sarocladium implicatum]|nr:myb DNA-binding like domain-containing protein [Sarocladium implicatum]